MNCIFIFIYLFLIITTEPCLRMVPPEEVGVQSTKAPGSEGRPTAVPVTTAPGTETQTVTQTMTETVTTAMAEIEATTMMTETKTEEAMTTTESEAEMVTTAEMEASCQECDINSILGGEAGTSKEVITEVKAEVDSDEGCLQKKVSCFKENQICNSIQVFAVTDTNEVAIGNDDIIMSNGILTCQQDLGWTSGTTQNIQTIYCAFDGCE